MTATIAPAPAHAPRRAARPAPHRSPLPAPRSKHLRVVAPEERSRRLTPKVGVVLTAGLFVTMFALAVTHTVLVQGQARLDALDAQLTEEQTRYQELRKDVAAMESPERIVAAAHEAGMVTPDDLVYLQPEATDEADPNTTPATGTAEDDLARAGSWPTVKPMLEAPTP